MCEVYSTSVKTLQTKHFFLSLFKMLLLQTELRRENLLCVKYYAVCEREIITPCNSLQLCCIYIKGGLAV